MRCGDRIPRPRWSTTAWNCFIICNPVTWKHFTPGGADTMAYTGGAGSPRKCSFLHYDGRDRAESEGYQAFVEDVAKLREDPQAEEHQAHSGGRGPVQRTPWSVY